jgi:hypothetical protein
MKSFLKELSNNVIVTSIETKTLLMAWNGKTWVVFLEVSKIENEVRFKLTNNFENLVNRGLLHEQDITKIQELCNNLAVA